MVTAQSEKTRRPLAVTIVVWVLVISGILNLILGGFAIYIADIAISGNGQVSFYSDDGDDVIQDPEGFLAEGIYSIAAGVVQLVIAIGFWLQKQWAWVAAVSWQALRLLVEIATPFGNPDKVPTMVFGILLIFLLNQSAVRRVFQVTRAPDESSAKPLHILDVN